MFRDSGSGFRAEDSGFGSCCEGLGSRVWGEGLGFRVQSVGLRDAGSGIHVWCGVFRMALRAVDLSHRIGFVKVDFHTNSTT